MKGTHMINYTQVADADPQGDLQAAFEALRDKKTVSYRALTGNEMRLWSASNPDDYSSIKAAAASSVVAEIAFSLIATPDSLLELNRPEVLAMVEGLVAAGIVSAAGKESLLQMATQATPVFAGLTQAIVLKARQMRLEGRA